MQDRCRIELLGGLRVRQGERLITRFRTQKFGSLLAYLAFHLPQIHARELLIEMLWPGCDPAIGRPRLSMALSSLRHQLEPPAVPAGAVLQADRFAVRLNPAAITTDTAEFESALRSASTVSGAEERRQALSRCVSLYRGPLLPGFYEEWILSQQQRLADLYGQAADQLIAEFERAGDLTGAIALAHQAIAADPQREEAHVALMRLFAVAGQPALAVRQYRQLERLLEQEMQEAPSEATREFVREISRTASASPAPLPSFSGIVSRTPLPAPVPPIGTVTFLLTEIERSADIVPQNSDVSKLTTALHEALLRRQFKRHGGYSVKEAGNRFVIAFQSANDALSCAIGSQLDLAAQEWPQDAERVRVRMALHTGEVALEDGEYQSAALQRASRLLTAAHGGQILCSEASAGLLSHDLEPGVHLRDLGVYRLADTTVPERLFQIESAQLPMPAFPPLRAQPGHAGYLPLRLTRFFGREPEIARLENLLEPLRLPDAGRPEYTSGNPSTTRLVTLTGPGGTGKTRLALQAADRLVERYRGAVWFVALADITEATQIPDTVLEVLGIPRSGALGPMDQVRTLLSRQPSLLVLDNFEHLVEEGANIVQTLIERIPTLKCLMTSRRRLDVAGEREIVVLPLPTPNGSHSLEHWNIYESVQLFVDRAQAIKPDFQITTGNAATVAALCDSLEGIPLAIELAAARAQVFTPGQMLAQLQNRFEFLVSRRSGVSKRHRTLRAAQEWSYRLLTPEMQRFFARLSVFRGDWNAEAAEAVSETPLTLDYLAQLRDCSFLLVEDIGSEMRFRMLETLREYAFENLPKAEDQALKRRHADWFLVIAQKVERPIGDGTEIPAYDRVALEIDNIRAALTWTLEADPEMGLHVASKLWPYWWERSRFKEGRGWLERALDASKKAAEPLAGATAGLRHRHEALIGLWHFVVYGEGEKNTALPIAEESLVVARELGNKEALIGSLHLLGVVNQMQGDYATARTCLEESVALFTEIAENNWGGYAVVLNALGRLSMDEGDYARARTLFEQSLAVSREHSGNHRGNELYALILLGHLSAIEGDYATAIPVLEDALVQFRRSTSTMLVQVVLQWLGEATFAREDYVRAGERFAENLTLARECGEHGAIPSALHTLALVAAGEGYDERMSARCRRAMRLSESPAGGFSSGYLASALVGFACVAADEGHPARAVRLFGAAAAYREAMGAHVLPRQRAEYDRCITELRAQTTAPAFSAAWAQGEAMTLQQVLNYALEETGPSSA